MIKAERRPAPREAVFGMLAGIAIGVLVLLVLAILLLRMPGSGARVLVAVWLWAWPALVLCGGAGYLVGRVAGQSKLKPRAAAAPRTTRAPARSAGKTFGDRPRDRRKRSDR
ncbi:MAG: hypothetical protein ACR2PL_24075 [Dehalococcoidia bacterium]